MVVNSSIHGNSNGYMHGSKSKGRNGCEMKFGMFKAFVNIKWHALNNTFHREWRVRAAGDISNSSRSNSKTTEAPIVNYTYQRKVVTNGFWLCMALEKPYWIFHIYTLHTQFFFCFIVVVSVVVIVVFLRSVCVCFYFMLIINIPICEQANVLFSSTFICSLVHSLSHRIRCLFAVECVAIAINEEILWLFWLEYVNWTTSTDDSPSK